MGLRIRERDIIEILLSEGGIKAVQEYIVGDGTENWPNEEGVRKLAENLGLEDHPALRVQ